MTKKVHWGIIGLGKIANKFAEDLLLAQNACLYAVASRSADKASEFKIKHQAEKAYSSYQALLEDKAIDIVYIALPHSQHYSFSLLALKHNKAVLCEKPLGMNAQEVETLQAEALRRNLFIMEGIWTRFIPATQKLISLLADGLIGDIISLKADFGFRPNFNPDSRLFDPQLGGGSLMDIGLYPLYLSLLVLGEPEKIKAMARYSSTGVDSHCTMLLQFGNGALANLESSFELQTPTEAFIYGRKGSIKIHSRFHHSEKITLKLGELPKEEFIIKYRGNGYIHEIEAVNESLLQGFKENSLLPHKESLRLAKLLDKVKEELKSTII